MAYWLLKSEPSAFGIDDLRKSPKGRASWDGVRNYQARNFMRDQMNTGDSAFFYHSNCAEPGIVGVIKITSSGYPDRSVFDPNNPHFDPNALTTNPRWYAINVQFARKLAQIIPLSELRRYANGALRELMLLRRGNRLSVMPVTTREWRFICNLRRN